MSDRTGPAAPVSNPPDIAELKGSHRAMWAAGDFARIAELTLAVGTHLVDRLGVRPHMDVLDVATGTGNAAIPAASAGARVSGLDLAPELLDKARERAANRALEVDWIEGDVENLPFDDCRFDRVLSTFGVQFAPRHDVAARELARVCAPGGAIGLANWTPRAAPARTLALIARDRPPLPDYASPPALWGVESHVRRLFAGTGIELRFGRATVSFEHNGSTDEFIDFYATHFGPLVVARETLSEGRRWETVRQQLKQLWDSDNEAPGGAGFRAPCEYLLVIGHRGSVGAIQ